MIFGDSINSLNGLRITFLLTQSLESPSGLGRYWALSKELVRLGHKVVILALHHDFRELNQRCFVRDDVTVHYVGQMHVRKAGNHKLYFNPIRLLWVAILATWRMTIAALRTPTDIYHIGKPHPMNGIAGIVASKLCRKPLYLDSDDYEAVSNHFGANWQKKIVTWFEYFLPCLVDGNTVNTRFMLHRLSNLCASDATIVRVPNGVDRFRFSSPLDDDVNKLRLELGLEGKRVTLYLGSMSLANHAVDLLLEAFVIVAQSEPEVVLLLVGGGEDYDFLRSRAKALKLDHTVIFTGRVSPDRAVLYYELADVSVDPVYNDLTAQARFPLKILESLATGTPVVTGDVGDRREILRDGEAGLLVPPGDEHALARGILHILQETKVNSDMQRAAEALSSIYYWDTLAPLWLKVYEEK